jgi:ABC-type transport system involved in multi-copper enzyme maturation permease subunit
VTAQLRSELLKQRSTGTALTLLVYMLGVILLVVLLHVFGMDAGELAARDNQLKVVGWGTGIGALFASLLGAISITGEIRTGLIRPTFLATPNRALVIAAKVAAGALAGVVVGLLAEALTAAVTSAGLAARGIDVALSAGDLAQLLAGGAAAAAMFAAIGVGVGALVRNQVGAVVGLCVWLLLLETILVGNVPSAAKFSPGASAGAIAGAIQTQDAADLLAPALGTLLLAVYAAAATAAGLITTERRDVA